MIYSATWNPIRGRVGPQFWTQLYAFGIGLVRACSSAGCDRLSPALRELAVIFYGIVAVLLLYVLFFGTTGGGARRWISLGVFNLQPSEFMKIALALALATFFAENNRGAQNNGDLMLAGALRRRRVPPHRQGAGPRIGGHACCRSSSASPSRRGCA